MEAFIEVNDVQIERMVVLTNPLLFFLFDFFFFLFLSLIPSKMGGKPTWVYLPFCWVVICPENAETFFFETISPPLGYKLILSLRNVAYS